MSRSGKCQKWDSWFWGRLGWKRTKGGSRAGAGAPTRARLGLASVGGKAGEEVGQILHGVEDTEEGVLLGGAATSGKILHYPFHVPGN